MTPNKPVIAEEARKLLTDANSKLENDMLDMVSRLAEVITYNAEAMNKLVSRVDELEKLMVQQSVPKQDQAIGECLENLLNDKSVTQVKCTYAASGAFTVGKVYTVGVDGRGQYIYSNPQGSFSDGIRYIATVSRFEIWGQRRIKPVIGYPLQKLLVEPEVVTVRCVKANSQLWTVGREYRVVRYEGKRMVVCDQKHHVKETTSLFVEVEEQREPFKQSFNLDFYGNTPTSQLPKEQRLHMFLEQTRMFMGLPTVHLIHPRSL